MARRLGYFVWYAVFWIAFFFAARLLFLTFHYHESVNLLVKDWIRMYFHGAMHDFSAIGAILMIPGVILTFSSHMRRKITSYMLNAYTIIVLVFLTALISVDIEYFTQQGFRLNAAPLINFDSPAEFIKKTDNTFLIKQIGISVISLIIFTFLYFRYVATWLKSFKASKVATPVVFSILTIALLIPIRGGISKKALTPADAFFHKKNFVNHATVNVIWNVGYTLVTRDWSPDKDKFLDNETAQDLFASLYEPCDDSVKILNTERPNIILVLLTNFTDKTIKDLSQNKKSVKLFAKLKKDGISFSNFYASGDVAEKCLPSVYSGLPCQPSASVVTVPEKMQKLPFLTKDLRKNGYYNRFYYGDNIKDSDFKSYLTFCSFDKVFSYKNIKDTSNTGYIQDKYLYDKAIRDLRSTAEPFFITTYTVSSREPVAQFTDLNDEPEFRSDVFYNSMAYSANELEHFIETAKSKNWWKNTLVIVMGEKGYRITGELPNHSPEKFNIPMYWTGGALAIKDTTINTYGSQTDLAATLFKQLNINTQNYEYSRNLITNSCSSFAYYVYEEGFGFIADSLAQVYDIPSRRFLIKKGKNTKEENKIGKAYFDVMSTSLNETQI